MSATASRVLFPEPTPSRTGRIGEVDVLRGFALMGILLINAAAIASVRGVPPSFVRGPAGDVIAQSLIVGFVESKFFTLFSFLFGLGFALQIVGARRRGQPFVPRFGRRMAALLGFGALHVALLWEGDILVIYAVTGTILLLFRNRSDRALLRWAGGLLAVPVVLVTIGVAVVLIGRHTQPLAGRLATADVTFAQDLADSRTATITHLLTSSYAELIPQRLADYTVTAPLLLSRVPTVLAMFLLGLYVGRRGIIADAGEHVPLLRRVRRWGFLLGLPASLGIVLVINTQPPVTGIAVLLYDQYLTGPLLSLAYAATIVLVLQRAPGRRLLGWLAQPGRMALTNYLTQSAVMTSLCYGYGFGLAGRLSWPQIVAISVVVYIGQTVFSAWWLRRFVNGPLEWVWRVVTAWQRQPLLRPRPPTRAALPGDP